MTNNLHLNLSIFRNGDQFKLTAMGLGGWHITYTLPNDRFQLFEYLKTINKNIKKIIQRDEYCLKLDISSEMCRKDLRTLAELRVLDTILLGDNPSVEVRNFVKVLKHYSRKHSLRIQIISEAFNIPWTLFYDEELEYGEEKVNPDAFWGFKHIIDMPPPIRKDLGHIEFDFPVTIGKNNIAFSLNTALDSDIDPNYIDEQKKFFSSIKHPVFSFKMRENEDDIVKAFMEKSGFGDSFTYFYCHANSPLDLAPTLEDTYIRLTTPEKAITLHFLKKWADKINFIDNAFVFINACESMSMNPIFYDSIVPFFITKGSNGVLGTISKIPALFASKFGIEFFKQFLSGQPIGIILPIIRKRFVDPPHNNLLGLLYTSYCHSELVAYTSVILK